MQREWTNNERRKEWNRECKRERENERKLKKVESLCCAFKKKFWNKASTFLQLLRKIVKEGRKPFIPHIIADIWYTVSHMWWQHCAQRSNSILSCSAGRWGWIMNVERCGRTNYHDGRFSHREIRIPTQPVSSLGLGCDRWLLIHNPCGLAFSSNTDHPARACPPDRPRGSREREVMWLFVYKCT